MSGKIENINNNGGIGVIVRSVEEVKAIFDDIDKKSEVC